MEIAFFHSARSKETQLSYCLIPQNKRNMEIAFFNSARSKETQLSFFLIPQNKRNMEIAFFNSTRSKETQLSYCLITQNKKIWTLHSLIPQSTHFWSIDSHLIILQLFHPHSRGIKRGYQDYTQFSTKPYISLSDKGNSFLS